MKRNKVKMRSIYAFNLKFCRNFSYLTIILSSISTFLIVKEETENDQDSPSPSCFSGFNSQKFQLNC